MPEDHRNYIRTSRDFQAVRQDREFLLHDRWRHWILMPWRHKWGREYDDALAAELKKYGHNGAFCDHQPRSAEIHERYGFPWYMDHTAGKGDLYLKDVDIVRRGQPTRPVCLVDPATLRRMKGKISNAVSKARKFTKRVAYALDDEVSWTKFTTPAKWDNHSLSRTDFARWLLERYGDEASLKRQWLEMAVKAVRQNVRWGAWREGGQPPRGFIKRLINPDDLQALYHKPLDRWNLSAWCDANSYMDSQFLNCVGELVNHANKMDPETPCGFVGGQAPAAYGGYDYAKAMRKLQFLEAYDIGASMEIVRSFNPGNALPTVKTAFGDPARPEGMWSSWYYLAHGDRGAIAWASEWFAEKFPADRVAAVGKSLPKLAKVSKKIIGAKWKHDGVALYYSQPSIQVSWFIDCQYHGWRWINRTGMNNGFAASIGTAWAWQKALEDMRVQYDWYSYASLLEKGIDPKEYKLLILPRTLCLSPEEADEIRRYVRAGGHVIADHMTGIFNQHGKAYATGHGILDDLFGIEKRPVCRMGSLFHGDALSEIDAETHYERKNFIGAGAAIWPKCKRTRGLIVAQRDLPTFRTKKTGKGRATHLNVSLIEYLHKRALDCTRCEKYLKPVSDLVRKAGLRPWVKLRVGRKEPHISEAVYWEKGGRVYVCVVKNPMKFASEFGETKTEGIVQKTVSLTITFNAPRSDLRDEVTGQPLPNGRKATVPWRMDTAAIVSFKKS